MIQEISSKFRRCLNLIVCVFQPDVNSGVALPRVGQEFFGSAECVLFSILIFRYGSAVKLGVIRSNSDKHQGIVWEATTEEISFKRTGVTERYIDET